MHLARPFTIIFIFVSILSTHARADEVPKDVAEVLQAARGKHPNAFKNAGSIQFMRSFDGVSLKKGAADATPVGGSFSPQCLVGADKGGIISGPGDVLQPGKYVAIFRVQEMDDVSGRNILQIDVTRGGAPWVTWKLSAEDAPKGEWRCIPMAFPLAKASGVNFRVTPQGHRIALDRIYLYSVAPTAAASQPADETADAHAGALHSKLMWDARAGVCATALTEDGRYLLAAFDAEDEVRVFDTTAWKDVTTLKCDTPHFILCRGNTVYVASFGHGKIECFDAKTWQLQNEVLSGASDVAFLSAPSGAAFKDRLIASHHSGKPVDDQVKNFLVDVKKDTHEPIQRMDLPTFSCDGTMLINEQEHDLDIHPFGTSIGEKSHSAGTEERIVYQLRPGPFWYDDETIYTVSLDAVNGLRKDFAKLLVPDQSQPVFYGLNEDELIAYREGDTLDTLSKLPLAYDPAPETEAKRKLNNVRRSSREKVDIGQALPNRWRRRDAHYETPLATTIDGTTSIFYVDSHRMLRAIRFPAVPSNAVAQSTAATPGAKDAFDFPAALNVGKLMKVDLLAAPGVTRSLVNPPGNMKLDANGSLTWTPSADEIGTQTVKIRIEQNGQTSFERHEINVVDANAVASAAAKPANAGDREALPLPKEDFDLTLSADGRSILILAGNQLRVTDATGIRVASTITLPRQYIRYAQRSTYDVALSNATLDLLDKKSHQVTRSIPLGSPKAYDLAIRPGTRTSYVSIEHDHGGNEPPELARRVCEVDETTGKVREIPNAIGQWVAVDPSGRHLYAGLHFLYENGIVLDFNIGETRPEYGDIDALSTFDLGDGVITRHGVDVNAGTNGRAVRVAPDGSSVAYVSAAGKPIYSYAVAAFDPADPNKVLASYSMKDHGFAQDLAYHMALPWVAVISGDKMRIFNRTTGDPLDDKLDALPKPLNNSTRCIFSPDGLSLLVDTESDKGRSLSAYPLKLTEDERKKAASAPAHPAVPEKNAAPPRPTPPAHKDAMPSA